MGPFEKLAKDIILGNTEDFLQKFTFSLLHLNDINSPIHLWTPKRSRILGVNFYIWLIGFYKIFIKVDSRPTPKPIRDIVLSANNDILMLDGKLSTLPEFGSIIELIK